MTRFGVPTHVVTDRKNQFESKFVLKLTKIIGFH